MSGLQLNLGALINDDAAFTFVQEKLKEALSINNEQALIIKSLNDEIARQQQAVVRIDAENEELISVVVSMIKEKRTLHSTNKEKSRLDQDKLREARDINIGHALMIKSLNDDIVRQYQVVDEVGAENEELENLIKESNTEHAFIIKSLKDDIIHILENLVEENSTEHALIKTSLNDDILRQHRLVDEFDDKNKELLSDMHDLIEGKENLINDNKAKSLRNLAYPFRMLLLRGAPGGARSDISLVRKTYNRLYPDKLREAQDINNEQALIIKSINNDITRHYRVVDKIDAENDELTSDIQGMIEETRTIHSTNKEKSRLDQDKLKEVRDINTGHALMIKPLNDDIVRQQRVVNEIDAENEELEDLIKDENTDHALIIKSLNDDITRQHQVVDEIKADKEELENLIEDNNTEHSLIIKSLNHKKEEVVAGMRDLIKKTNVLSKITTQNVENQDKLREERDINTAHALIMKSLNDDIENVIKENSTDHALIMYSLSDDIIRKLENLVEENNTDYAVIIKSPNDDILCQYQVIDEIDGKNEELTSAMQDLIEEKKKLAKGKKANSQLGLTNNQPRSENYTLMDELEKKNLGWLEESEVEELKRTKEPLLWKLEARQQEAKQSEEPNRMMDTERDCLTEQLAKSIDRISELSSAVLSLQQTIDELEKSFLPIRLENSSLKLRIQAFDPSAKLYDTLIPQIFQMPVPPVMKHARGQRKSLSNHISSIPGFFMPQLSSFSELAIPSQYNDNRKDAFPKPRRQTFSVHSNQGSTVTTISTEQSSNIVNAANHVQQLFAAGDLEVTSDEEDEEEDHTSISTGEGGENSAGSFSNALSAVMDMHDLSDMQDLIEENNNRIKDKTTSQLCITNNQPSTEKDAHMDELEKKRLGWVEESTAEELKRQTTTPLLRKLEARRQEAKQSEERNRLLDVERDLLAEQLAKPIDRNLELSSAILPMQQTIDELEKSFLPIRQENLSLKFRIQAFDPSATFRDTPIPQIFQMPVPPVMKHARRKSLLNHISSIPGFFMPQRSSFFEPAIPSQYDDIRKNSFPKPRRQTFSVHSNQGSTVTQISTEQSSNIANAANHVRQMFAAGDLEDTTGEEDEEDKEEDHKSVSIGKVGKNSAGSFSNALNAVGDMHDLGNMQDLIEGKKKIFKDKKAKSQLGLTNTQLRSESNTLMDELEKNNLGWLEESEVEELKQQTAAPLLRKLEARQQEAKQSEELNRLLDTERDCLAEQLAKSIDRNLELFSAARSMQQTIDELEKSFLPIRLENSSLKLRIQAFDPSATFRDRPIPQILQMPVPPVMKHARGQRKSLSNHISSIPGFFMPQRSSFSELAIPSQYNDNRKDAFPKPRRQTFSVHSNQRSTVTTISTEPSSNIVNAANHVQQLFAAGDLEVTSDEEDDEEDHKSISTGEGGENSAGSFSNALNAVGDLHDLGNMQDLIEENIFFIKDKKAKSQLGLTGNQLRSESDTLMDELEKKRLGWVEESAAEELKRQTTTPLLRKLEARRQEAKQSEERNRLLEAEGNCLAEQLAKSIDRNLELSSTVLSMQQTIDELDKTFLPICQENLSLKFRIRAFDPGATFRDTPTPQILQLPVPPVMKHARRKSLLNHISSIPGFFIPQRSSYSLAIPSQYDDIRKDAFPKPQRQTFSVHSNQRSTVTQISTDQSSNIANAANHVRQMFADFDDTNDEEDEEEDHKSISIY